MTSFTEQCLDYIRKHGSARSHVLEEAIGMPRGYATSLLAPYVKKGELVVCKVEIAGRNAAVNEYRFSVAGGARVPFTPLRGPRGAANPRPLPQTAPNVAPQGESAPPPRASSPAAAAPGIGPIEKGVPLPARNNNGVIRAALAEMAISDLRRFDGYTKQAIQYAAKKAGVKVTIQKDGEAGFKVWRTA